MRVRVIKDVRTREIERKIFIAAIRSKIIASTTNKREFVPLSVGLME